MRASTTQNVKLMTGAALVGLALLVLLFLPAATAHAESDMQTGGCDGYYYTVKTGDTWIIISRRTGVTVANLKVANPQALRRNDWVLIGEKLCIPAQAPTPEINATPTAVQPSGYWYQVRRGDTWNSVARAHGATVAELWAANPDAVNELQWLYVGQRLWIPARATATPTPAVEATATAVAAATATAAAAEAAAETATDIAATATAAAVEAARETATAIPPPVEATPAATATELPQATPTQVISPLPTPTPLPAVEPTVVEPTAVEPAAVVTTAPVPDDCPEALQDYGEAVLDYLNDEDNTPGTLQAWLEACRVVAADVQGVVIVPVTARESEDVVVTIADPAAKPLSEKGQLLVYHQAEEGYDLAHMEEGVGRIALLEASDINADKKFDLAYSDTSCGAHTCFATLAVISWDGEAYEDWIADEPTIADPDYTFKDVSAQGQGQEILVHGGVIGSLGAGPQRAWTETYISSKGGEYTLLSREYDPSTCLYHKILDANAAFDAWASDGFGPAIELYTATLEADDLEACGTIEDEVATLQDFARFRLIVAAVAAGEAGGATELVAGIRHTGLRAAANAFLTAYSASGSVIQACRDTTKLAEFNTSTWDFLADWGYANPSLTAGELCPLN